MVRSKTSTTFLGTPSFLLLVPRRKLLQPRQTLFDVELDRFEDVDGVGSKFREFLGFAHPGFHSNCGLTGDIQVWHRTMYGLDFGNTQRVETRQGTAYVREAAPAEQFWKAWRKNKDAVKAARSSSTKTIFFTSTTLIGRILSSG